MNQTQIKRICLFVYTLQVNKIEVQYDKTSKQVDVQALKETLWDHIQESNQVVEVCNGFTY